MSLIEIRAKFTCDECGSLFSVEMEPSAGCPPDWTMMEMAEDAVRGSLGVEEGDDYRIGCVSVQEGKHLCTKCTEKADEV